MCHVDSDDEDYLNGMVISDRLEKVLERATKTTNNKSKRDQREEIAAPKYREK